MNFITDDLVETAAKALDEYEFPGEGWDTEASSGFWRTICRERARAVLKAVFLKIAAEIWDEGFEAGATWEQSSPSGIPHDPPLNPYD